MKEVVSELMPGNVQVNLKTDKGKKLLSGAWHWDDDLRTKFYAEFCNINDYLKSLKKSHLYYNDQNTMIFAEMNDYDTIVVRNRMVYFASYLPHDNTEMNFSKIDKSHDIEGVILTDIPDGLGYRALILCNGDDNINQNIVPLMGKEHPTCSFACLARFYDGKVETVHKKLVSGQLRLVDFTKDQRIDLTDRELIMLGIKAAPVSKAKKAKPKAKQPTFVRKDPLPPEPGFTLMNRMWHRSGTVIFHDSVLEQYILMGQDEGTYFGVQLPAPVATVAEAFNLLMPEEVRGKTFKRQGEWFALPVEEKDVPNFLDCSLMFSSDSCERIYLPIESKDSKLHHIDTEDGRVGKDGKIYVKNVSLIHDDHASLTMTGWCTFYRNTAVRSFSQEGVD